MDAQAKKALFRSKLNAQKKEKRIDSPLVRYNELDQPVCRVCELVLKSESLWPAHQASRKHNEAVNKLKAGAASNSVSRTVKPAAPKESSEPKSDNSVEVHGHTPKPHKRILEHNLSSGLPSNNHDKKRQKAEDMDGYVNDSITEGSSKSDPAKENGHASKVTIPGESKQVRGALPQDFFDNKDVQSSKLTVATEPKQLKGALPEGFFDNGDEHPSKLTVGSDSKQVKGAIPEGFFDNKDADLRARGITPVKPDVKDKYKEYEKLIQEDLQVIDNRMEEEEYDAAEMIEEAESIEQRTCRERVEMLRKKKMELKAAKAAVSRKSAEALSKQPVDEESSSDEDSDDNLAVDWRAKHL